MAEIIGKSEKKSNSRIIKTTVNLHVRKDDAWSSMQGRNKERPINTKARKEI